MESPRVTAVCVVHELLPSPGKVPPITAIDKRPAPGRVGVEPLGLVGDQIGDLTNHGGIDQAVYAYAEEDAAWWAAELGEAVPAGRFGENLRTEGLDLLGAVVGERWAVGPELVLEVTSPRIPCSVFQHWMQQSRWVKRFTEAGRTGAYLRVVTPGTVAAGDVVTVLSRPEHGVTVAEVFPAPEPARMAHLLASADAGDFEIAAELRRRAGLALGRA